ncbi:head GIN domain-containing protein [Gaoshiqia sp. Z1-71]|uniref:head GIN domain-containing protein n=1 Tax=Gaoshiqia hydrogeniformans TaxID=3290090 RepID=UPI003BF7F57F
MKTKLKTTLVLVALIFCVSFVQAGEETREVPAFSEISFRIPGKLHLEQGSTQSIEIVAKESTLEQIITEVKGRELIIRFPNKNLFWKDFDPGKIEIFITVPEIGALTVSGSGQIYNDGEINTRILNMSVSGSGDILLDNLKAERVKATISGSGRVELAGNGKAEDLSIAVSGSGSYKGFGFASDDVSVKISGSGGADVNAERALKITIAGSGNVTYTGRPLIDQTVLGSGRVIKK